MSTAQSSSGKPFAQDHRGTGQGPDTFTNEGGGQTRSAGAMGQSDLRHDAELAVKSAKETLGNVRDMAGDVYEGARKSATDSAKTVNDAVINHPWASVGIAAGIGLLFGLILNRVRN